MFGDLYACGGGRRQECASCGSAHSCIARLCIFSFDSQRASPACTCAFSSVPNARSVVFSVSSLSQFFEDFLTLERFRLNLHAIQAVDLFGTLKQFELPVADARLSSTLADLAMSNFKENNKQRKLSPDFDDEEEQLVSSRTSRKVSVVAHQTLMKSNVKPLKPRDIARKERFNDHTTSISHISDMCISYTEEEIRHTRPTSRAANANQDPVSESIVATRKPRAAQEQTEVLKNESRVKKLKTRIERRALRAKMYKAQAQARMAGLKRCTKQLRQAEEKCDRRGQVAIEALLAKPQAERTFHAQTVKMRQELDSKEQLPKRARDEAAEAYAKGQKYRMQQDMISMEAVPRTP